MSNAFKEVLVLAMNPFVLLAAIATNCIQKLLKKPSKLENSDCVIGPTDGGYYLLGMVNGKKPFSNKI
jgi:glycosyltransferase A (GT-A) superfamily protein (DUF2064 family)